MLDRNFIEKIEELAKNELVTIDGVEYSTRRLNKVSKPMAANLDANSLEAAVKFIKSSLELEKVTYPLMVNVKHNRVEVHSQLTTNLERDFLLNVNPLLPSLNLGQFVNVEDFIIKLQTCFVQTDNRDKLLALVSNFMSVDTLDIKDDGFGQSVTIKKGAVLNEEIDIQPIVKLKPVRTFNEVEQVESLFLFRIERNNRVALFEADGGAWKDVARNNIVAKLSDDLGGQIIDNKVVIIG